MKFETRLLHFRETLDKILCKILNTGYKNVRSCKILPIVSWEKLTYVNENEQNRRQQQFESRKYYTAAVHVTEQAITY